MNFFYDRSGSPMSFAQYAKIAEAERRVARDTTPDGKVVSTVWLGIDHAFSGGPPLIFETMVFPSEDDFHELDGMRYSTEEEARAGHLAMVVKWSDKAVMS